MDFNFTNIREHPTNAGYLLYFYRTPEHGDFFRELLRKEEIEFEEHEEADPNYIIYFAVRTHLKDRVNKLNFRTLGEFRKPFITDPIVRYFIVVLGLLALGLAIAGYFISE